MPLASCRSRRFSLYRIRIWPLPSLLPTLVSPTLLQLQRPLTGCFLARSDTSSTVFSLQGSVLKFDTRESIEAHLEQLTDVAELEEVRFGGNTLGIDACAAVGDALSTKKGLKVRA